MIDADGQPKVLLAECLEVWPFDGTDIPFEHVVPVLRHAHHAVGDEPHLVRLLGALRAKEVVASVNPTQRSSRTSKVGKESLWKRGMPMPSSSAVGEPWQPEELSGN